MVTDKTIKALRFYGKKDIRIDSIPTLTCGTDEVRIKIAYCGICGSDLHEYDAGPLVAPQEGETHEATGCNLPTVLGHEMSGTVTEIGKDVTNVKIGDNVTVLPALTDRAFGADLCQDCQLDRPNLCQHLAYYGYNAPSGGFAEEAVIKSQNVYVLQSNIPLDVGALVEPLAVAWHCVRLSGFKSGQDAVVLGAGPIGLAVIQVLKVHGARKIIASEVLETRADQAREFGADVVVNPLGEPQSKGQDVVTEQVRLTCGFGAHVCFDATGFQSTLDTAISCTRAGGLVFNIAIHEKPLSINPTTSLSMGEKFFTGATAYVDQDFKDVIDALGSGLLKPQRMITSVVPLSNVIEKGFGDLINKKGNHVKILIKP